MHLIIDGDGCPAISKMEVVARRWNIPMHVYIDYSHHLESDYFEVYYVDKGSDSVDMKIIAEMKKGDIIVTQDYGLASYVLTRGGFVIHVSGKEITNDTIDLLLDQRHRSAKQRKQGKYTKIPKRVQEDDDRLIETLDKRIRKQIEINMERF